MYEVIAVGTHSGVTLSFLPRALVNSVVSCVKLSISGWGWGYPLCAAIILASKSGFKCQGLITVYSAESAFLQTQLLSLLWWFCSENSCFQLWKVICWHDSLMPQHYGFRESKLKEEDAWFTPFVLFGWVVNQSNWKFPHWIAWDSMAEFPFQQNGVQFHAQSMIYQWT